MAPGVNGAKRKAQEPVTSSRRAKKPAVSYSEGSSSEPAPEPAPAPKRRNAKKVKAEISDADEAEEEPSKTKPKKKAAPRKPKAVKPGDSPLEERTLESKLRIGAHVSAAGGVYFYILTKYMRTWLM